jgi:hypothetical protein
MTFKPDLKEENTTLRMLAALESIAESLSILSECVDEDGVVTVTTGRGDDSLVVYVNNIEDAGHR